MGKREELFKDEAADLIEEMEQLLKDMKDDGICATEDIRRIAKEMDELWDEVSTNTEEEEFEEDNEENAETT